MSEPTPWAYQQACKAIDKHRQRAEEAETEIKRLRAELAKRDALLIEYGRCAPDCHTIYSVSGPVSDCSCGWADVVDELLVEQE